MAFVNANELTGRTIFKLPISAVFLLLGAYKMRGLQNQPRCCRPHGLMNGSLVFWNVTPTILSRTAVAELVIYIPMDDLAFHKRNR